MKDSFEFAKLICKKDAGLFMASLYVGSLFTNVPLEETIDICVNELFNKKQITEILNLITKEFIILFDMAFTLKLTL